MSGYLHADYAKSLDEFGSPRELRHCGGWIIERPIDGFPYRDAMGSYPLFCCQDWSKLHLDLEKLNKRIVSLALVTDPFGEYSESYLKQCFSDLVIPFKEHFIVDLSIPIESSVSKDVRYKVRKAFKNIEVGVCQDPFAFFDDWIRLYKDTIEKYNIRSVRAFSKASFVKMFAVPGFVQYRASYCGETIGIALVFIQGDVAFAHLISISDVGYKMHASYALYWYVINHLALRCRWFDLMGIPGASNNDLNNEWTGLKQYKSQWSHQTRMTYFCGRIFDQKKYSEILHARNLSGVEYFPAYRGGEFG